MLRKNSECMPWTENPVANIEKGNGVSQRVLSKIVARRCNYYTMTIGLEQNDKIVTF